MIVSLSNVYSSCFEYPKIEKIDTDIFKKTYFGICFDNNNCHDICCQYGVDIDYNNIIRLEKYTNDLEKYTNILSKDWFIGDYTVDNEFPGGKYKRTNLKDGRCVFLNRKSRGCMIHSFCLEYNIDFHLLKPFVGTLFPITFDNGLLQPSLEIIDMSLFCINDGVSLYRGVRDDLLYYFGKIFIYELDRFEKEYLGK